MPTIVEHTIYQFDELDDRAKDRARDWYREGALDYDWWDCTYDDAARVAGILGIDLRQRTARLMDGGTRMEPSIYFSGFSSQRREAKRGIIMRTDPVLAARRLPKGTNGYRVPLSLRVEGGLHYLKGNAKPYFALTYTQHRAGFPNQCWSGGAGHEHILKYYPRFADLAALHLSDIDGEPMHAEANGWYILAAALGGMGERYHAGNSKRNFPCVPPADKPWKDTEYREPTQAECVQLFANHCRIPIEEAQALVDRCAKATLPNGWGADAKCAKASRDEWCKIVEELRPRWKQQAEACIAHHHLHVYGDPWESAA